MQINLDETRILVASADKKRNNTLNLDEFLELVFSKNDALDINLKHMPGTSSFLLIICIFNMKLIIKKR